jgi:hypothetical protein
MEFFTRVPVLKSNFPIDYHAKIWCFGSCFSDNMSQKFNYFKFQHTNNPFGIIFNAVSIEKLFQRIVENRPFTAQDLFYHNQLWHSFELHSDFSDVDQNRMIQKLNQTLSSLHNQLPQLTHCIITLGSSWVYRHIDSNQIVANCHKLPQALFTKEILSIENIENSIRNTIASIQNLNPKCHFVFTVSPVRHIKDGFVNNQRSKAHLISALHNILVDSKFDYFPSFEIMLDELRDYRFYTTDMLHPNPVAIDYIWEKFTENYISDEAKSTMNQVNEIQKGLMHKPFQPGLQSHQLFLEKLQSKIQTLKSQFEFIEFE